MKTSISKTLILVMIVVVSVMMVAQIAKAASVIKGSKHDLSSSGPADTKTTSTDQVCVFCHTPHFASAANATPLWNRSPTSAPSYQMYTSDSLVTDMTGLQPTGVSAACLSCHDGTVAFDSLLNKPGSGTTGASFAFPTNTSVSADKKMIGAATKLGSDLRDDHPISFTYVGSSKLTTPTTGTGIKPNVGGLPLYGGKLECASCHNVHDPGVAGTTAPFLRATNAGSALCLTCHIK